MISEVKKNKIESIAVLGAGNWGTVLALLALKQVSKVYLYDHDEARAKETSQIRENKRYLPGIQIPNEVVITSDLKMCFEKNKLVMPIIPASVFRGFVKKFSPFAQGDHFIVHGTKGLEPTHFKRMSEIIYEETGCLRIGALSGPNLALELAQNQPSASVVASRFEEVIKYTQTALASNIFRVYGNHDLIGVEWSGALKNILAIGAGIISQLGFGQNALAMLLTRGVSEIGRLLKTVGGEEETLLGLAGMGDIIATCTSPLSRNFRAGQMLAQGLGLKEIESRLAMTIEGVNTVHVAHQLASAKNFEMPITAALYQVIFEKASVKEAIRDLMGRPVTLQEH